MRRSIAQEFSRKFSAQAGVGGAGGAGEVGRVFWLAGDWREGNRGDAEYAERPTETTTVKTTEHTIKRQRRLGRHKTPKTSGTKLTNVNDGVNHVVVNDAESTETDTGGRWPREPEVPRKKLSRRLNEGDGKPVDVYFFIYEFIVNIKYY